MRRELIPYYVSRALIAGAFGVTFFLAGQPWWTVVGISALMFAGFLWYAHNGHYLVDASKPLMPLRRDERGAAIRDRALVLAMAVGGVLFAAVTLVNFALGITIPAVWAVLIGAATYFAMSQWYFMHPAVSRELN